MVQLSASGTVEVQQDFLTLSMNTTREGPDASQVQAQLRTALDAAFPGVRYVVFGHLGDGNLHYNLSAPEGASAEAFVAPDRLERAQRIVHDLVRSRGGSISAEHGIGRLKRRELARVKDAGELALMRRIKEALDPRGLLNPGKIV